MAFSLQEALEQVRSDKIKDRQQGLEALEHIFSDSDNVRNLDTKQDGKQDGKAWLKTFQALFGCVLAEKAACIRKGSFADAQPISIARLQRAAQMLRSLVEKAASLLTRKVVKALVAHILQMLDHRGTLLRPIAPAYTSALCAILKHQHHVDHLDPEDWWAAASLCFDILLGRDLNGTAATSNPAAWLASIPTVTLGASHKRGLSLEDAVTAECLRHLMACTVAPLLGSEGHGIDLLSDYTRFLLTFPTESSAHLPAMTGLVMLLEHLELNHTREVICSAIALRHILLSLWKTKNHLLKIQILLLFRIVVSPLASCAIKEFEIVPPQDMATLTSLRSDAAALLESIYDALLRDPDTRWALDSLRLDASVFQWPQHTLAASSQTASALCNSAFYIGPFASDQDSLAWCRITLQVDLVEALRTLDAQHKNQGVSALSSPREQTPDGWPPSTAASELPPTARSSASNGKRSTTSASSSPKKRRKTGLPESLGDIGEHMRMEELLSMIKTGDISQTTSAASRLCALQLLVFLVLSKPHLIESGLIATVRSTLQSLTAEADSALVSWSLVGLGAVVRMYSSASPTAPHGTTNGSSSNVDAPIWSIAVRKLQLPETCRAAAFLLTSLLVADSLPEATLQAEIKRLLAEVDLQGPPIICDSVCHLMTLLLQCTTSNRTYQHLDPRRKIGAWFSTTYTPSDAFQSGSSSAANRHANVFVPYQDLSRLMDSVIAEREIEWPDLALGVTSICEDAIAQMLQRRTRLQPLRELALNSAIQNTSSKPGKAAQTAAGHNSGPILLSAEAFHRMTVVLEKKVDACLEAIQALTADSSLATTVSPRAAVSAIHAALLAIEIISRSPPQGSSARSGRLRNCCQVLVAVLDTMHLAKTSHTAEHAIVLQQLELLAPPELRSSPGITASYDLMLHPGPASGIANHTKHIAAPMEANTAFERDRLERVWTAIRDADMLESMLSCCDRLLERALFGDEELDLDPNSATSSSARDAFDDMAESLSSNVARARAFTATHLSAASTEAVVSVAVRILGGVPRLLTGSADSRRDELVVSLFFDCSVEGLVYLSPVLFESFGQGSLWMCQRDLVDALDRIGAELLTSYRFAREPVARIAAIRVVAAVLPLLLEDPDEQSDLFDKVQKLAAFFADQIGRTRWPTPWEVQLACARFLAQCLHSDPERSLCRSGSARGTTFSPLRALLQINADSDIRVRGLGSSMAAAVFGSISDDEAHLSDVYTTFREGLPSDSSVPQQILTRALSLSNAAIANASVRRSSLFHLLEIVLATGMFPVTVQQLFAQVAAQLGFHDAASCYQAFAGQITWGMATNGYDPLQVPWKVVGFASKRECLETTFASCGSMLLAAQTPEGRTQFDALVQLTRRTQQQGLQECLPFLTAAYLGFSVQSSQESGQLDVAGICQRTLHDLSQLGFAEGDDHPILRKMIANADDLIVTMLLSLYFDEGMSLEESRGSAITALQQHDANSAQMLSALTPTTKHSGVPLHEPSRPFFPAATVRASLPALKNVGIEPFSKEVVYNVLRHLFHHIASSRFVNDQLRLVAALRIYIAMAGDAVWTDLVNAKLLMKSIEQLLAQSHLHDEFRPFLVYACDHSVLAQDAPETLVSCIVSWSVQLGDRLTQSAEEGSWLLDAAIAVAQTSPVATSATALLWPGKLTSREHVAIESLIDIRTLAFAINSCPHMSLQLPALLRVRSVLRRARKSDLEAFCISSAWKLLQGIASGPAGVQSPPRL